MTTFDRTNHITMLRAILDYLREVFPDPNRIQSGVIAAKEQELRFWINHEKYLLQKQKEKI
jgi:hypothetical protein